MNEFKQDTRILYIVATKVENKVFTLETQSICHSNLDYICSTLLFEYIGYRDVEQL